MVYSDDSSKHENQQFSASRVVVYLRGPFLYKIISCRVGLLNNELYKSLPPYSQVGEWGLTYYTCILKQCSDFDVKQFFLKGILIKDKV